MRYSPNKLFARAKALGLEISQWSPGDRHGTRYQAFGYADPVTGALYCDYGTYCGASEFAAFLRGFEAARSHAADIAHFSNS